MEAPRVADPSEAKFVALQVRIKIGTAAYATMALREVTKTETISAFQTGLTKGSKDQEFRGTEVLPVVKKSGDADEEEEEGEGDVVVEEGDVEEAEVEGGERVVIEGEGEEMVVDEAAAPAS